MRNAILIAAVVAGCGGDRADEGVRLWAPRADVAPAVHKAAVLRVVPADPAKILAWNVARACGPACACLTGDVLDCAVTCPAAARAAAQAAPPGSRARTLVDACGPAKFGLDESTLPFATETWLLAHFIGGYLSTQHEAAAYPGLELLGYPAPLSPAGLAASTTGTPVATHGAITFTPEGARLVVRGETPLVFAAGDSPAAKLALGPGQRLAVARDGAVAELPLELVGGDSTMVRAIDVAPDMTVTQLVVLLDQAVRDGARAVNLRPHAPGR